MMIDRGNWKLTEDFLEFRKGRGLKEGSLRLERTYIRYLLEWANDVPFRNAPKIRPMFTEFLLEFRLDGSNESLSHVSIKKGLVTARRFFTWLYEFREGHSNIKPSWIETLSYKVDHDTPRKRDAVTYEEILEIARAPVEDIGERRIRAAAVFLFLSGIRISAFVSLPLKAVDIDSLTVKQHPELGVKTKNNKHATTYLYPIPELVKVVKDWDDEIRKKLSPEGFWFAPFSPETRDIDPLVKNIGEHRHNTARRNLKAWLRKVGLPYHAPHKFRHGHIQWGYLRAKKPVHKKAISENVMHSNTNITDGIYSNLKESDLKDLILDLGNGQGEDNDISEEDIERIVRKVVRSMKEGD